jgi:hypothetical protein
VTQADARREHASQGGADGSSGSGSGARLGRGSDRRLRAALVLALGAGVLMVATEFLEVFAVSLDGATSCEALASPDVAEFCSTTGGERHSYALVLLGLFTFVMAWGATVGRSRPAGAALLVVGLVVVGIALLGDLPEAYSEGIIGPRYDDARSSPGLGFWTELVGGVLAAAAGVLRLSRPS